MTSSSPTLLPRFPAASLQHPAATLVSPGPSRRRPSLTGAYRLRPHLASPELDLRHPLPDWIRPSPRLGPPWTAASLLHQNWLPLYPPAQHHRCLHQRLNAHGHDFLFRKQVRLLPLHQVVLVFFNSSGRLNWTTLAPLRHSQSAEVSLTPCKPPAHLHGGIRTYVTLRGTHPGLHIVAVLSEKDVKCRALLILCAYHSLG